jgi:hypothetical protein
MPAVSNQSNSAAGYLLLGDGRNIGAIAKPSFQTATSLAFQISSGIVSLFYDSLSSRKGCLPFQTGAMVILGYDLKEIMRYSWRRAVVTQIDFPALDALTNKQIVFSVNLSVMDITEGSLDTATASSQAAHLGGHRNKIIASFIFRLRIDGLESACVSVSEIGGFAVGQRGSGDLTIAVVHEGLAEPFRNWLRSGNAPKSGSLDYLYTDLDTAFTVNFTGLQIRSVEPAFTTLSSNPARIHLTYSGHSSTL